MQPILLFCCLSHQDFHAKIAVHFKHRFNHKGQGSFPMARKEAHMSFSYCKAQSKHKSNENQFFLTSMVERVHAGIRMHGSE
jgi:hypothetical protein